jgi:hypothetical protein
MYIYLARINLKLQNINMETQICLYLEYEAIKTNMGIQICRLSNSLDHKKQKKYKHGMKSEEMKRISLF